MACKYLQSFFHMKYTVKIENKEFQIEITERDGRLRIDLDGKPVSADSIETKGKNHISFLFNNKFYSINSCNIAFRG